MVKGAPDEELTRSPAALAIGQMAAAEGLFLTHYEYRVQMPAPEHWLPHDRPDLGEVQPWRMGVLPESKYQAFRNDLMIGAFHPGHRAKWTAHELCHGLVGFAWRPGATPLYTAVAARLSELLPVALFYFFDEIGLRRCPDHAAGGPLFGAWCGACEAAARGGSAPRENDDQFKAEGLAFVRREIDGAVRSLRAGRPIATPWANLDLSGDGLAYAAAQYHRLSSPEFADYMALFYPKGEGMGLHRDLDSLIARIERLVPVLCGEADAPAAEGNAEFWMAADVGWRLMELAAETDGEVHARLMGMIESLASRPNEVDGVVSAYEALFEEFELPEPADLFAVGYPLTKGYGRSVRQIADGLASACPHTVTWLERQGRFEEAAGAFTEADSHQRIPLGKRFAAWTREHLPEHAADLAQLESATAHAPPVDMAAISLERTTETGRRLNAGVSLLQTTWSVLLQTGAVTPDQVHENETPGVAIRREPDGETAVLLLTPDLFKALQLLEKEGSRPAHKLGLAQSERSILDQMRLIVPDRWL